ncbi:MAG: DUF4156 domain-containing protein [Gammaproteobacteria bacterium HGW-Gammaproteobacteria-4]|jgi:hypothetical protein|nr:MAG: DUF4156 domain-containing protein [Gammaproteobacteria bacterium HGW-Gammaproteobacteria-4]
MAFKYRIAALVVLLPLSACAWVKLTPAGEAVRVARADEDLSGCTRRGEIGVSVKDRLGPIERNHIKVIDELEMLARNEAVGLNANTIQPKAPPDDGEQRFLAYVCGAAASSAATTAPTPAADDGAQTYPVQER